MHKAMNGRMCILIKGGGRSPRLVGYLVNLCVLMLCTPDFLKQ